MWFLHRFPQLVFYPLLAIGTYVSQSIFVLSFIIWISVTCGWFQRFVVWWIEREVRRILNDTQVTIGGLQIHWWHGQVDIFNVILHTPRREEWQWQSPLIGRVGKISVQASISGWAYYFLQYGPRNVRLEIYTVRAEDIQVFVERQQHIFNFYLCDPMLELPDPKQLIQAAKTTTPVVVDSTAVEVIHSPTDESSPEDATASSAIAVTTVPSASTASPVLLADGTAADVEGTAREHVADQQQAQQLVNDMVMAVQSLGEAAQRGKITTALHKHRQTFASKLKQLTQQENSVFFRKSVQVMQQVSHAVVQNNKRGRVLLPFTPPAQRGDRKRQPPVHGRVGRVVVRNVRVFTRATGTTTTTSKSSTAAAAGGKDATPPEPAVVGSNTENNQDEEQPSRNVSFEQRSQQPHTDDQDETIEVIDEENAPSRPTKNATRTSTTTTSQTMCWNKPLYIQQVVLRASELCPPKSLVEHGVVWNEDNEKDEDDIDYPAIYQPLDKVAQVVLKRLLAEMAKSNTGRLLETAMGEVVAYLQVTQTNTTSTTATKGATLDPTATPSSAVPSAI